jgi:hypothetical protein
MMCFSVFGERLSKKSYNVVVFPFAFHIAVQQPLKPLWSRLLLCDHETRRYIPEDSVLNITTALRTTSYKGRVSCDLTHTYVYWRFHSSATKSSNEFHLKVLPSQGHIPLVNENTMVKIDTWLRARRQECRQIIFTVLVKAFWEFIASTVRHILLLPRECWPLSSPVLILMEYWTSETAAVV